MANYYGFRLRACRPYRAKTKGKVERFNGYLKNSFITPLAATLKQAGLSLDVDMANGQVGEWLDEIAHQRIHGTTGKTPESLLIKEKLALGELPAPAQTKGSIRLLSDYAVPIESLQHPLSTYDQLIEVAL